MSESTSFLKVRNCSAIAAFSAVIAEAQFAEDPTARNSNLLPVNANGEVRFLSVLSTSNSGICPTPRLTCFLLSTTIASFTELFSNLSRMSLICVPKNTEIIAGGASCAPKRCEFVADEIDALSRALFL